MKHAQRNTRLYGIWYSMKHRCNNKKDPSYRYYGGRGIAVCDEWQNDFFSFQNWAHANGYRDDLTVDRIDSEKGYEPSNCRFITFDENRRHRGLKMDKPIRTQLRMSRKLHEKIRELAYIRKVSLNQTMNDLMEKGLTEEEAEEQDKVKKALEGCARDE